MSIIYRIEECVRIMDNLGTFQRVAITISATDDTVPDPRHAKVSVSGFSDADVVGDAKVFCVAFANARDWKKELLAALQGRVDQPTFQNLKPSDPVIIL